MAKTAKNVLSPEDIKSLCAAVAEAEKKNKVNPKTGRPYTGVPFGLISAGLQKRGIEDAESKEAVVNQLKSLRLASIISFGKGKGGMLKVYKTASDCPQAPSLNW